MGTYRVYLFGDPAATTLANIPNQANPVLAPGDTTASLFALAGSGSTYWVRVSASNTVGEGALSPIVAILPAGAPQAVTTAAGTTGHVELTWTSPRVTPSGTTGYRVYAYTDAAGTVLADVGKGTLAVTGQNPIYVASPATTASFGKLVPGTRYYFRVRAATTVADNGPSSLLTPGVVAP